MTESLREKSTRGIAWSAVERFALVAVRFVIELILARLLTPNDYGVVGMLAVFLAMAQTLIDSGFGQSLVQNQKRTERDFATMFYFNVVVAGVLYLALYFCAPFIAAFYNTPLLIPVLRVISFSLVISSLSIVHLAKLQICVDFKTQAKATVSASLISGIVGISMACYGMGVWALVAQTISCALIQVLLLWHLVRWTPSAVFCFSSLRRMFKYGSKIVATGLINELYNNLYVIFIGRLYSASALGLFSRAESFVSVPANTGTGILSRVTFPVLAQVQDDDVRLKSIYNRYLRFSASVVVPVLLGVVATAKPLVNILLGENWAPCIPMIRILCLAWMCNPVVYVNLNLIYVKGRTDLALKLEIIKKVVATVVMLCGIPFGLMGLCVSKAVYSHIAVFINTFYTGMFLRMTYTAQIRIVAPIYVVSMFVSLVMWVITILIGEGGGALVVAAICGALLYALFSYLLRFEIWTEGVLFIEKIRKGRIMPLA